MSTVETSSAQAVVTHEQNWQAPTSPAQYTSERPLRDVEAAAARAVVEHAEALDILS